MIYNQIPYAHLAEGGCTPTGAGYDNGKEDPQNLPAVLKDTGMHTGAKASQDGFR